MPAKKQDIIVAIMVVGVVILGLVALLLAAINTAQEARTEAKNATMVRHVNPLELKAVAPPPRLLEDMIASVFEALAKGNTMEAIRLVKTLNETVLPERWKLVIGDVVADLAKLVQLAENATILEKHVKTRAALNDITGILESCKEVRKLLANLNVTYNMLVDDMNRLRRLGVNIALLKKKLEKTVAPIQQLEQRVHETLLEIRLVQHKLHPTKLWLNATPSKVFYGENIAVKGCLASDEGPLPGKPILLHYDTRTRTLRTGADGCFETTVKAVTEKDYITMYAEYVPQGRDRLLHTYARSPTIHVKVLRVKPILIAYVYNHTVYPGENVTIRILSNIEKIKVIVKAFGITQTIRLKGVSTNYTLYVPPHTPTGVYNVTVIVPRQDGVAEASATDWVMVVREPLHATVHVAPVALAGLDLPVALHTDVAVRVFVVTPWSTYTVTVTPDKTHTVRVHIPTTYPDVFARVRVVLEPLDPRYERYSIECSVVVLNPLALATLFTIPLIVLVPVLRQRQAEHVEMPARPVKARTREKHGKREATTYGSLLRRVEEAVGARLLPSETLREYLARVRGLLDENAYTVLERIVRVYEAVLYGGRRELVKELMARVEELERVRKWSRQNS